MEFNEVHTTKISDRDAETGVINIPSSLMEKLWESYETIDEKRRKTFYYQYFVMVVFTIIWITNEKLPIPLFDAKLNVNTAFTLAPAFISILMTRYLYLCAYSTISFKNFLRVYQYAHKSDLSALRITFAQLSNLFKIRDLTEKLNLYMFPVKNYKYHEESPISFMLQQIANFLLNIGILLSVIIPLLAYIWIIVWLGLQKNGITSTFVGGGLYLVYIIMGLGLLVLPIHFYYRIKYATEKMKKQIEIFEDEIRQENKVDW